MIKISDNSLQEISEKQILDDFSVFSGKNLKTIQNENKNIFLLTKSFEESELDDKQILLEINGSKLKTFNILGFLSVKDSKMKINSRFDNSENDFFLYYMLLKVLNINILKYNFNFQTDNIFNFLLLLFPSFLSSALSQGVYKEYKNFIHNDSNVKGVIDINRHIQKNIPFNGKIAYKTREFSYDNRVNQLIRHTIEFLEKDNLFKILINENKNLNENIFRIKSITSTYTKNDLQKVINQNIKPILSPYFSKYKTLQKLCIMILKHKKTSYVEDSKKQVFGILFDGAFLWEEYLATILKNFIHPQNRSREKELYIFPYENKGKFYPDFYNKKMVLDAKYKKIYVEDKNKDTIQRPDLYQIISYMHLLELKQGGLIYPYISTTSAIFEKKYTLKSNDTFFTLGFPINTQTNSFEEFCQAMKKSENEIFNTISKYEL